MLICPLSRQSQDAGAEANASSPEALAAGSVASTADPVALSAGPVASTAGPVALTAGPVALTADPVASTAGSVAVTAGSLASTAVSEPVTTCPEAENASLEAKTGLEAVTEDEKNEDENLAKSRLILILTEMIQDLKKDLIHQRATLNTFYKDLKLWKNTVFVRDALGRGAPEDPVPEVENIAIRSRSLQHALKLIKEIKAENEERNAMTRMALWTAAICYEALADLWPHRSGPKFGEQEVDEPLIHILLSYVLQKNEHTELFQKFLNSYGILQVDVFNSKGVSPLFVAIENNNLEMVKALIQEGANWSKVTEGNDSAMHAAVGHPIILKYLVEQRIIPEYGSYNNEGFTAMHLAVISKQLQQVILIADTDALYLCEIINKGKKNCLHIAVEDESVEIVEAIFKRLERRFGYREYSKYIITSQVDDNGHTPFHAALRGKNKDVIELFLRNGAFLSEKGKDDITALEIIATRFNDASNILCNAFDVSISISTSSSGENIIDYSSFTDIKDSSQINVIEKIVQYDQSDLLLHPLIQSYVYLKWNYFLPLFYIMISVHAIFLITFNVLVANIFYYRDTINVTVVTNQTSNGTVPWFQLYDWRYWTLISVMYAIITVLIVQV